MKSPVLHSFLGGIGWPEKSCLSIGNPLESRFRNPEEKFSSYFYLLDVLFQLKAMSLQIHILVLLILVVSIWFEWNVQRLSGNACFYQMIIYGYNDIDMDTSIDIDIDMDTMIY